jgi:hypothetical protein
MQQLSRREMMQGTLRAVAGTGVMDAAPALGASGQTPGAPIKRGTIKLAEILDIGQAHNVRIARQVGITHAICGVNGALAIGYMNGIMDAMKIPYEKPTTEERR